METELRKADGGGGAPVISERERWSKGSAPQFSRASRGTRGSLRREWLGAHPAPWTAVFLWDVALANPLCVLCDRGCAVTPRASRPHLPGRTLQDVSRAGTERTAGTIRSLSTLKRKPQPRPSRCFFVCPADAPAAPRRAAPRSEGLQLSLPVFSNEPFPSEVAVPSVLRASELSLWGGSER